MSTKASVPENIDLIVVLLLTTIALLAAVVPALGFARPVVGLVFALLVPGYVVSTALFPREASADGVERLALSIGFSIVVAPILALILSFGGFGFALEQVVVGLGSIVALFVLLTWIRRRGVPAEERFVLLRDPLMLRGTVFALLSIVLIVGAIQIFQPSRGPTELYFVNEASAFGEFPSTLRPGEPFALRVVVHNREGRASTFSLRYRIADVDETIETPRIANGERWETSLEVAAPLDPGEARVEVDLYRGGRTTPYRSLELVIEVDPFASVGSRAPA